MTKKFNVGDKVYDILRGVGKVTEIDSETTAECGVVEVTFKLKKLPETYSQKGFWDDFHINPSLLTISEARAKGYDVPRERVKKSEIKYGIMTQDGLNSSIFSTKAEAQKYALTCWWVKGISTITTEWEEEI